MKSPPAKRTWTRSADITNMPGLPSGSDKPLCRWASSARLARIAYLQAPEWQGPASELRADTYRILGLYPEEVVRLYQGALEAYTPALTEEGIRAVVACAAASAVEDMGRPPSSDGGSVP